MLKTREIILAKAETTYNTDPTPAANTDAVLVEDLAFSFEGARMNERPATRPSLGKLQHVYGGTLMQVTFSAELRGPGSAYSASNLPDIDPLLLSCGMAVTVVTTPGSETATYKPASTAIKSCTIYLYRDGKRYIVTGCRGNVEFTLEAGQRGMAKFTMTGHVAAETDTALATPTFDATVAPTVKAGTLTLGAYAAIVNALNFSLNTAIAMPGSINSADGYGEIRVTGRDVSGSIDPEDVLVATYDFDNEWRTGVTAALTTGLISGAQYNRYTISFPVVHARELSPGDRDGITTWDYSFGAAESAGDDEVSIIYS